jgi:hypothetical protein
VLGRGARVAPDGGGAGRQRDQDRRGQDRAEQRRAEPDLGQIATRQRAVRQPVPLQPGHPGAGLRQPSRPGACDAGRRLAARRRRRAGRVVAAGLSRDGGGGFDPVGLGLPVQRPLPADRHLSGPPRA